MLCIHFAHNKRWCLLNSVALLRPVGAPAKTYSSAISQMSQKLLPVSIMEHSSNNYSTQLKLFKTKQLSVPTQNANKATTKKSVQHDQKKNLSCIYSSIPEKHLKVNLSLCLADSN